MSSFYTDKTPDPVKNAKGIHLITSLTPNGRKVHILLEELKDVYGLEWTTSLIDLDTKEQKKNGSSNSIPTVYNHFLVQENQTTSTNPIPPGRIPILIDNTRSPPHPVMESSAELLYLVSSIDKDHQFWFSDPIEQSEAYQWLIFWHASGQPIQGQYNYFRRHTIDPRMFIF
ncbi:unnamed protein product [Aspergillus oryzae]|uniref:Unnamed protein product n=1 Tax=Aspergillus oryzae TaxID=5062 RepID=A0AAN4YKU3_ASPOZ|nr:unnamed protein product [Aspergillus oryzae]